MKKCDIYNNFTQYNLYVERLAKEKQVALSKEKKVEIITKYGSNKDDTGSTRVQIALLTTRINELTEHFKIHKKDHTGRRGLLKLVGKRRSLLNYLKNHNLDGYRELIAELSLRK